MQVSYLGTKVPFDEELASWAAANPPPLHAAFASRAEWDAAREPWFEKLVGKRLPEYGHTVLKLLRTLPDGCTIAEELCFNRLRREEWGRAVKRHAQLLRAHERARERAEKIAAELAAPAAAARGHFPCAHDCRCRMRWPLGTRLVINGVEKELARNNHGVLQWEIYYP